MKNQNRHTIGIILLAIISFQAAGYIIAYKLWQMKIQNEVKWTLLKGIPDEQLSVIKVHHSSLQSFNDDFQLEDESEFRYKGEMYDVVRKEYHNDSIWYFAFHDSGETHVLTSLVKIIANNIEQDSTTHRTSNHFLMISQLFYVLNITTDPSESYNRVVYFNHDPTMFSDTYLFKTAPPPKPKPII